MRHPLSCLLLLASLPAFPSDLVLKNDSAQVFFSPHGGCLEAVVAALAHARKTVKVQAYSFTSAPIAAALKAAHDRGVEVAVILDKSQRTERFSDMGLLLEAGIPTWVDAAHAIAHNKIIVIDGERLITGSFNFTKGAEERNAENLLIIQDRELAKLYEANWEKHREHSETAGRPAHGQGAP